jgi:hypothetical protein
MELFLQERKEKFLRSVINSHLILVARARRRGDRPPTKNKCNGGYISGQCRETRNSLSLSSEKLCGSRHLVFWSLGTLTGLRD